MNKTIKEQAVEYANKYYFNAPGMGIIHLVEAVITEERKQRRLPTKEVFFEEYESIVNRNTSWKEDRITLYDWLLSYEGEHIVEVNEKIGEDYQAKYNEAMVIIKRQAGDLQLSRESIAALKKDIELIKQGYNITDAEHTINRNELAEKILIGLCNAGFKDNALIDIIVSKTFSLADEFIKQAKS